MTSLDEKIGDVKIISLNNATMNKNLSNSVTSNTSQNNNTAFSNGETETMNFDIVMHKLKDGIMYNSSESAFKNNTSTNTVKSDNKSDVATIFKNYAGETYAKENEDGSYDVYDAYDKRFSINPVDNSSNNKINISKGDLSDIPDDYDVEKLLKDNGFKDAGSK